MKPLKRKDYEARLKPLQLELAAMARWASHCGARIVVDTRAGALAEAGDLVEPMARGVIGPEAIAGDLAGLLRRDFPGRRRADEITLFKSVGTALEDLAATRLVLDGVMGV